MSDPFLGEIKIIGFTFAPLGWAFCDGQLLPIEQNSALYTLIETTYGGDGLNTFALPDLRGRVPIHFGTGPGLSPRVRGQMGGAAAVALTEPQLPSHGHTPMGAAGHDAAGPSGNTWGTLEGGRSGSPAYFSGTPDKTMSSAAIDPAGSTSPNPHNNLQPYLAVNFIISTEGEFPSRG